jgi:DNA-directed RNA polymerase II subunit RPB1
MNLHTSASEMSRAELELISCTEENIIGAQASKPIICIVQDSLLGAYLMTKSDEPIRKDIFYNLLMDCPEIVDSLSEKLKHIKTILYRLNIDLPLYCGKTLISLLLPNNFHYTAKNKALEHQPEVKIRYGVMFEGALTKVNIGANNLSLIKFLQKEYSNDHAVQFVNNIQFITNKYMLYHSMTVGIKDCIPTDVFNIKQSIHKCFMEADHIENNTQNKWIREAKMMMALNKARDVGMRIAKESLNKNNNFLNFVTSGSKGDYFNVCQITGLLGQQAVSGQRAICYLNNGERTLPHEKFKHQEKTKEEEYKSKGFITNSFFQGLTPMEFWYHACSGREGVIDTATKTSTSGYTSRKMVKIMEDMIVQYDGTVRDSSNHIIQFNYSDGFDGSATVLKNDKPYFCDIERLIEKLNNDCELNNM